MRRAAQLFLSPYVGTGMAKYLQLAPVGTVVQSNLRVVGGGSPAATQSEPHRHVRTSVPPVHRPTSNRELPPHLLWLALTLGPWRCMQDWHKLACVLRSALDEACPSTLHPHCGTGRLTAAFCCLQRSKQGFGRGQVDVLRAVSGYAEPR